MALLTISSNNPKLSFVVSKNPHTIAESGKPFAKDLRKGRLYGWFTDGLNGQSFRLWFKDSPVESSFAEGALSEFEYLDTTRYGSPYLPIMMIQTALATASKDPTEEDVAVGPDGTAYTTRVVTVIKVGSHRLLDQMANHYAGRATITHQEVTLGYYEIIVQAPTAFVALNVLQVICVLYAMRDKDSYVQLDKAGVLKYINVINRTDAPYYVRYLFASRAITTRSVFEEMKPLLETETIKLNYGDTRMQRYDAIAPMLNGSGTLVDIGCGEMFYTLKMVQKYGTIFAVDADQEIAEANQGRIKNRAIANVNALHQAVTPEWVSENDAIFQGSDVLITEVLEHMPEAEADSLLKALLSTDARRVVATVPNGTFNENYGLSEDFRHPDHHYEPSFEAWSDYVTTLAAEKGWDVHVSQIGDIVNGQSVSTMAVFVKEE